MEIWEITIYCVNGPAYSILGDEDTFKAELAAWKAFQDEANTEFSDAQDAFNGDGYASTLGFQIRQLEGFGHNVQRYPAVIVSMKYKP